MLTRRQLLRDLLLLGGYSFASLGTMGWALAAPQPSNRHFIFILMRGAVDGLSIVAPYREQNYYRSRPTIALDPPGTSDGLLDLDGFFGLHPSLSCLIPRWRDKSLAFIHASGSPSETRSHFEAQDIMETAILNTALASQGWMNGLAQLLPDNRSSTRALSFGSTLPKIFQGKFDVTTVPLGLRAQDANRVVSPQQKQAYSQLYRGHPELNTLYQQGVTAHEAMAEDLQNEMMTSGKDAPNADGFTKITKKAAAMIRNDPSIQLMFMDVGGWDTHVGQGNAKGQLANRLGHLGDGLTALTEGLGSAWKDTAILIMSEFGRTVSENGNHGTDHGHGNVAWLMGGRVSGGKMWGLWPGLEQDKLYQQRDLAITTDFRSIIGTTLSGHFGIDNTRLTSIIPQLQPNPTLSGIIG